MTWRLSEDYAARLAEIWKRQANSDSGRVECRLVARADGIDEASKCQQQLTAVSPRVFSECETTRSFQLIRGMRPWNIGTTMVVKSPRLVAQTVEASCRNFFPRWQGAVYQQRIVIFVYRQSQSKRYKNKHWLYRIRRRTIDWYTSAGKKYCWPWPLKP